ncbi:MAG TPA: hypothetical protein PK804_01645 [Candidatus Dojkabacteria bacterium]|uniref:DUF948 domain-containing protein n=1 Tax=Candidatus Dojkabacteria bacterium TaxID=2099670 RepID=A0A847CY86_9BACT|nr:hypothetical protein [Candidatus Dojkabacteria bacterium]HOZ44769.1 hypothetical protein [Candidatus Dojkabacteria bacterium]HQC39336.1 hypothetical protein [Candidatus Dojkabacteria bacterium]
METIPPIYWMIVVGILTALLAFILYEIGMFVKESRLTLKNVEGITSDTKSVVSTVKTTVEEVNDTIIQPIKGIGTTISAVNGFVAGLKGEQTTKQS